MTALLLVLLLGGAKAPKAPKPAPKPKLEAGLLITPRGFQSAPAYFEVRIRAYDPRHELSCPAYHIDCNDGRGHVSSGLSDCEDPLAMPEDRPLVYWLPERVPVKCGPYYAPGEYAVRGILTDSTHGPGQASAAIVSVGVVQVTEEPAAPAKIAEDRGH